MEFVYNNTKNVSTSHMLFELNYQYHPRISFEDKTDPHSKSYSVNKLVKKLRNLMSICQQNLFYAQKLQK